MRIVCPQCAFERHIPEDRLPSAAVIATCPHCQHRFRIARPEQATEQDQESTAEYGQQPKSMPSQHATRPAEEDDPLPPGAVIPGVGVPGAGVSGTDSAPPQHTDHANHAGQTTPPPSPQKTDATAIPAASAASHVADSADRQGKASPLELEKRAKPDGHDENDPEYRRAAASAYEKHAEEGEQDFALDNPWEQPERDGYPAAFYQTCMRVMFAAPRFFSGLQPDTPQRAPLFFFLLVCVIQILVERFWGDVFNSYFASTASNDPQLQQLLGMLAPQSNIMLSLLMNSALKTLELFIASGLFFLIFKLLAPANANYSLIFQVMAYSVAPAMLCVVPVAGSVAGFIWSLACTLVGCRYALRLTWTQTVLGIVPLYGIGILFLLHLMSSLQQAMA